MAKANVKKKLQFWGTGRRKKAIARVRLLPAGDGAITINNKSLDQYLATRVPFNPNVEGNNEITTLKDSIEKLIDLNKSKNT